VKSKVKKTTGGSSKSKESHNAKQKKRYKPPKFIVLTADQATLRLTERALPGEAAIQQLLAAISKSGSAGIDEQRSRSAKAIAGSGK
jgi:hypothetical protein